MGYCHIRFIKNASNLCTIILSLGKYCYKRLPMGVADSPESFQQKMNDLFHGFRFICAYIYDLLILTEGYWTDHVHKLELMINERKEKGLKYSIKTLFFRQTKKEYLGLWVTRNGVKPISKKI